MWWISCACLYRKLSNYGFVSRLSRNLNLEVEHTYTIEFDSRDLLDLEPSSAQLLVCLSQVLETCFVIMAKRNSSCNGLVRVCFDT